MKDQLLQFCETARKAQVYGDVEVAEFKIEDFYVAYDRDGGFYYDDKLRQFHRDSNYSVIVYRNKNLKTGTRYMFVIDDKTNYKNWYSECNNQLEQITSSLEQLEEQYMSDSFGSPSVGKRRV